MGGLKQPNFDSNRNPLYTSTNVITLHPEATTCPKHEPDRHPKPGPYPEPDLILNLNLNPIPLTLPLLIFITLLLIEPLVITIGVTMYNPHNPQQP